MMTSALLALLSLFPISFLAYVVSERLNSTHQSRVGMGISFSDFFLQTWSNSVADLKRKRRKMYWGFLLSQISIVFLLDLNLPLAVFGYLALNLFLLTAGSPADNEVIERIESDRAQLKFFLASVLAFLGSALAFSFSGSTSLTQVIWTPAYLLFIPVFQIAGMILFGEYPFVSLDIETGWLHSIRFYVWCMLSVRLFLGGDFFYFDGHLKALALFVLCRLFAQYFPRYTQRDLFRLGLFYLVPVSVLLWLATILILGAVRSGGLWNV